MRISSPAVDVRRVVELRVHVDHDIVRDPEVVRRCSADCRRAGPCRPSSRRRPGTARGARSGRSTGRGRRRRPGRRGRRGRRRRRSAHSSVAAASWPAAARWDRRRRPARPVGTGDGDARGSGGVTAAPRRWDAPADARAGRSRPGRAGSRPTSPRPPRAAAPTRSPASTVRARGAAAARASAATRAPRRYRGQLLWPAVRQTCNCWRADCGVGSPTATQRFVPFGVSNGGAGVPDSSIVRRNGHVSGTGERVAGSASAAIVAASDSPGWGSGLDALVPGRRGRSTARSPPRTRSSGRPAPRTLRCTDPSLDGAESSTFRMLLLQLGGC